MILHGHVKSLKEFHYRENEKTGEIGGDSPDARFYDAFHNFNDEGYLIYNVIYPLGINGDKEINKYDGKGNVKESFFYNADGVLQTRGIYKYDDKGNNIEYIGYNADGSIKFIINSQYDKNGCKIEETILNKNDSILNGKNTYKYDDKGNQIEFKFFNPYGIQDNSTISKYDEMGNQIETEMVDSDGRLLLRIVSEYDSLGNQIETDMLEPDGRLRSKAISTYDEMNYKNAYVEYNSDGKIGFEMANEYRYDKNKNWIHQIVYFNKKPITYIEREIEYYK